MKTCDDHFFKLVIGLSSSQILGLGLGSNFLLSAFKILEYTRFLSSLLPVLIFGQISKL